jgi:hypothetical protein
MVQAAASTATNGKQSKYTRARGWAWAQAARGGAKAGTGHAGSHRNKSSTTSASLNSVHPFLAFVVVSLILKQR